MNGARWISFFEKSNKTSKLQRTQAVNTDYTFCANIFKSLHSLIIGKEMYTQSNELYMLRVVTYGWSQMNIIL